jgi:methylated-DNA-[protein]-cysteine S-methyltransferase
MSKLPATAVRVFETPLGRIGVAATARGVVRVTLPNKVAGGGCRPSRASAGAARAEAHAARAQRQIRQYCAGRRRRFTVTIDLSGVPPFHRKVLAAARRIPYGRTVTYGELARRAGSPRAARAAGQAMAHNPVPLIVPCHRVVASGGLGGFGGGLALKRLLLALEAQPQPLL